MGFILGGTGGCGGVGATPGFPGTPGWPPLVNLLNVNSLCDSIVAIHYILGTPRPGNYTSR